MAKLSVRAGATGVSVNIAIQNSSSQTGAFLTGFAPAGGSILSGLTAYYSFSGVNAGSVAVSLSAPAAVNSAFVAGQLVEIDSTHMPGVARFDVPNAALAAANGRSVTIMFSGGANVAPVPLEIELTGWDNQDAVHGGMSALPNTACTTNASLLTSGAGPDQVLVSSGQVVLTSAGLDQVLAESGITASAALTNDAGTQLTAVNLRQAIASIFAQVSGVLAGAVSGASTITTKAGGNASSNTRGSITCDSNSNRTAVTLKVPT